MSALPAMTPDELRDKAKELQFYAFGTTRIFERRAARLKTLRTWITFLGIIIPVIIGGTVLSFGADIKALPYFIFATGVVGMIQLALSTWAIVARWDESYEYAVESLRENTAIYNKAKAIIEGLSADPLAEYLQARRLSEDREFKDLGQSVLEKEKRFANRETLRYFRLECHLCKETPHTATPSNCDACGKF